MSPFVRPATIRPGDRTLARSALFLLLAVYTATFAGLPDNPDAEVEFQTTSSLARRGTLALDQAAPLARRAIEAGHGVRAGGPGREGESFAWFGVGQAALAVPLWAAGHALTRLAPGFEAAHRESRWYGAPQSEYFEHLLVGWRNPLLGALTAWLIVLSSRRLGAQRLHAWLAGLSYGLCSFAWPQAVSTLSDVQATFFLFLCFHLLLRVRESYRRLRPPSALELAGAGLALAAALWTRAACAPACLVLALAGAFVLAGARQRRGRAERILRDAAAFYGAVALGVVGLLYVNQVRFGSPLESGYGAAVGRAYFSYPPLHGLAALLAAPGRGLAWLAPAALVFPLALARGRLRRGWAAWTSAAVALATLALVAPTQGWHGAHAYGPRYLLPALPFLWLGVAPALDLAAGRGLALAACCLVGLGLVTALPGVLVSHTTHLDLATRAAALAWPDAELGLSGANADEERFQRIQWSWAFAAPWAHWRILRHRVAGLGEGFGLPEIFFLDEPVVLTPTHERARGFRHMAWVDFHQRLGGPLWPAVALCTLLLGLGIVQSLQGLDPGTD